MENLEEMLNRRTNDHIETVLGDFNFDYISPNTTAKRFQRTMNLFNLKQLTSPLESPKPQEL